MIKKMLILILSVVVLAGCGKEELSKTKETNNQSVNSTEKLKENETKDSVKPELDDSKKSFKEDLDNSVNEIWYLTSRDVAKDSKIVDFFVINDKKVSFYQLDGQSDLKTLGELSKMEDEEILSYIKEERDKVDLAYNEEKTILTYSTKPVPYKISVKTDATGNSVVAEQISAELEKEVGGDGYPFAYNFTMDSMTYLIYSQEYLGFEVGLRWNDPWKYEDRTRIFRKRKSENDWIMRDQATTEGIEVDGN